MGSKYMCDFCNVDYSGRSWQLIEGHSGGTTILAHLCFDCMDRVEWIVEKLKGSSNQVKGS